MTVAETPTSAGADRVLTKGILGEKDERAVGATSVAESHPGIFSDIESAVIAARQSQEAFETVPMEKRQEIIEAIRNVGKENADALSKMAVAETGLGRIEDKIKKHLLASELTPGIEDLKPTAFSGGHGLAITERVPFGVICSITPVTNPSETIINNGISMIAAGNSVIFCPHPRAQNVSLHAVSMINREILKCGGPENLLLVIEETNTARAQALMRHPGIDLLVVTGGADVVAEAKKSNKKLIAAGPGNPPVVVDETANIEKAGKEIVDGASLDNGVVCTDEKEVFVVDGVCDRLKEEMKKSNAFELDYRLGERLRRLVLKEEKERNVPSVVNRELIGKNAEEYLKALDIEVRRDIRLLILETERDHPFVATELLMPILPIVRARDIDEAIEMAVEAENGRGHTASMYSRNIEKLSEMARVIKTAIFVENGPSFSGLGLGGEGYTSFTVATGTGEGLTTARTFTRERRCTLVDYFKIV